MRRSHHSAFQCYADILMLFLCFTVMCMAALLLVANPKTQPTQGVKPDAQYLVTLTWDSKRDVDLDLWLRDQDGNVIYYNNRESPNVSLDRDSRGFATNRIELPDGSYANSDNREVISLRGIVPGDYLAAVGYYAGNDETTGSSYPLGADPQAAIDFHVEVEKVNPKVITVFADNFHFDHVKQSTNVVNFHVAADGTVTILPLPPISLVQQHGGEGDQI